MNRLFKSSVLLVLMLILAGCENNKVTTETTNVDLGDIDVDLSMVNVKDRVGAEDYWSETVSSDKSVFIEADVVIPDVSDVKIIQEEERYFTPEEKEEIIRVFSDEDIYVYPMNIEDWTVSQLEEEIEWFEEYIEAVSDNSSQEELDKMDEELQELYAYLEDAPTDYSVADDFSGQRYISKYNGYDYLFAFFGEVEYPYYSSFYMETEDYKTRCDGKVYESITFDMSDRYTFSENMCVLTEDDACAQAKSIAEALGYGDFTVGSVHPLLCNGWSENNVIEDSWYEGYNITLYREIDGIEVDGRSWEEVRENMLNNSGIVMESEQEGEEVYTNYGYEKIIIAINDNGILRLDYMSPFLIKEVISEDTELLDYNSIQDILIDEINYNYEIYKNVVFNKLEFKYYPVRYDEEGSNINYAIVPVWILTVEDSYETRYYVMVNAIDGEIIHIEDNEKLYTRREY